MDHCNGEKKHWYSWQNRSRNLISGTVNSELVYPPKGSIGEFITEHYWGYSKGPKRTTEYRVEHPQWQCCEVKDYQIDVDFAATYGDEFSFLSKQVPYNVLYAEGSVVSVSFPRRI